MKKFFAIILAAAMLMSLAACNLFADDSVVQFEDLYTHNDPKDLTFDERKVLINKDFGASLEETVNAMAYPDTIKYDDAGNIVGIYDYDPETGLASGYMDVATGAFVEESVDLGKPDEAQMIHLKGDVVFGVVIYGNENKAVAAYLYALLTDAADKQIVKENLETYYGVVTDEENNKVLVCKEDEAAIDARFQLWQQTYGQMQSDRSASGYADNLKLELGLKNYGANPYKPCSEIVDPEDIEFDEKVILTSNGAYSFADSSLETDMVARTDVVYAKEGKVVAHYTYYEYKNKTNPDKLMNAQDGNFYGEAKRISDTVVQDQLVGNAMQDLINAYIGYNILQDDSLQGYVENLEGTYFAMIYEQ